MKQSRFTEEQIIGILKAHETGVSVAELYRKHGISDAAIYKWKAKYGDIEAKRLELREDENAKPRRLLTDTMRYNAWTRRGLIPLL